MQYSTGQGGSTLSTTMSAQERRQQNEDAAANASNPKAKGFSDLPLELREIIWRYALPGPRVFDALTYVSAGLETQLLERGHLKMPLAHACFESRRVVKEAGYVLAFRDANQPDDPGVWYHPKRDVIERTIWAPGDIRHQDVV